MGGKREENEGNQVESMRRKVTDRTLTSHMCTFIAALINSQLVNSETFICVTIKHFSTLVLTGRLSSPRLPLFYFTQREMGSVCV